MHRDRRWSWRRHHEHLHVSNSDPAGVERARETAPSSSSWGETCGFPHEPPFPRALHARTGGAPPAGTAGLRPSTTCTELTLPRCRGEAFLVPRTPPARGKAATPSCRYQERRFVPTEGRHDRRTPNSHDRPARSRNRRARSVSRRPTGPARPRQRRRHAGSRRDTEQDRLDTHPDLALDARTCEARAPPRSPHGRRTRAALREGRRRRALLVAGRSRPPRPRPGRGGRLERRRRVRRPEPLQRAERA